MQQTPQYNSGLCMQAIQSHSSLTSSTQPLSNWPETAEWHFIYSSQVFWLLLSVALLAKTPPTSALSCDNNFALSQIPFWWQTQAVFPNAIPEGDRGLYLGITESFEPRLVFSAPCTTCTGCTCYGHVFFSVSFTHGGVEVFQYWLSTLCALIGSPAGSNYM